MGDISQIETKWELFKSFPFPTGYAGMSIHGIVLGYLDTSAAGCIDTFVSTKGKLSADQIDILKQCSNELDIVLGSLDDGAANYFRFLRRLCEMVLQSANGNVAA